MTDTQAKPADRKVEARVLLDTDGFACNQLISGSDAERGIAAGWADGHPDAIAFAKRAARKAARSDD